MRLPLSTLTYLYQHPVGDENSSLRVTYWEVDPDNGFINFKKGSATFWPGTDKKLGVCLCNNRFLLDENEALPQHYLLSGTHTARPCQYAHLPPAAIVSGMLQSDTIEHLSHLHTWAFKPLHNTFIQPRYVLPLRDGGYPRYPMKIGRQWKTDKVTHRTPTLTRRKAWKEYGEYMLETGDDPLNQVGPEAQIKWGIAGVAQSIIVGLDLSLEIEYQWEEFE